MVRLPSDPLNRIRPLSQALADLVAKHDELHLKHPERSGLARMIAQLEVEIAWRAAQAAAG